MTRLIKDNITGIFFPAILMLVIFASCSSSKKLVIEIPIKGQKELPSSIQSLTIITRTIDDQYEDTEKDSIQKIFYQKNFKCDTIINDIRAVDTTLKALGELLYESGRYDFVIPEERFYSPRRNAYLNMEMDWEEVKRICNTYETDALLSLENFKTKVITNYKRESIYSPGEDAFILIHYAYIGVVYEAFFRVYDPSLERVISIDILRDTLLWEKGDIHIGELFRELTPIKTALMEAGIAIALDYSEKLGRNWQQTTRDFYFGGNSDLKHAATLVQNDKWEQAMTVWKELSNTAKSKSVKSKAELNLAVAYELEGDLPEAIRWALKSYDTMYRPVTYDYLNVLKKRKENSSK